MQRCREEVGARKPVKLSAVEIGQMRHRKLAIARGVFRSTGAGGGGACGEQAPELTSAEHKNFVSLELNRWLKVPGSDYDMVPLG